MKKGYTALIGASMIAFAASGASATPLLFSFSGPSGTAVFQLDSNPTPDYVNPFLPGTDQFGFNNVAGTYGGVAGVATTINFGEGIYASLNIVAPGLGFTQFGGPALFGGTASAPIFSTGTYTLPNPFLGNGTLVISNVAGTGSVPEPASWAMMVAGFGLSGATIRYRRRRTTAAFA